MPIQKQLIIIAIIIGLVASLLELYIGHTYLLEPLFLGKEANFIKETWWSPTYYGFYKFLAVAIAFYIVYQFNAYLPKIKYLTESKYSAVGVLGTMIFGVYYYFIRPPVGVPAIIVIGITHYLFITITAYIVDKYYISQGVISK